MSAYQHAGVIDVYLANEVRLGGMVGPFNSTPVQNLHMSSFGVIPKKGQPGKWYLIVDLSSPQGHSVSDGIDPDSWHLQYIKIDDIINMVLKFGPGALMAKFDIESAHRNIAVHPCVMLITWTTPCHTGFFQLSLFLILWQMSSGFWSITMAAPANSSTCASNLHVAVFVVARLSLPLYPHKLLGPTSGMVVLGIELDTVAQIDAFRPLSILLFKMFSSSGLPKNAAKKGTSVIDWSTASCLHGGVAR